MTDIDLEIGSTVEIDFNIDGVTNLSGLTDVSITSIQNNDFLIYNLSTGMWENTQSAATVSWGGITGTLSDQTDLQTELDAKVSDTGNETIAGIKTFSSSPIVPTPTTDFQASTKKYVDDNAGAGAVSSVFTRTGAVVAATNDYTWAQIDKTTSDIADITTKSHTSLTDKGSNTHTQIDSHIANVTTNPHSVDQTDVGLGNVSNVATDDTAYNATSWNTNNDAATKNAIRDKIETMDTAIGLNTSKVTNATHTGDVTGSGALTIAVDAVNDTHIDWGTGANQVSQDDVVDGTTYVRTENNYTDAEKTVVGNTSGTNTGDNITMTNFDATNWRVFYSNGTGDVTELALGADGTFLKSNGASSAPTFAVPAGSGDVSKVGTPVDNQVGVWTGDGTIEGTTGLTYTGTALDITGNVTLTGTVDGIDIATDVAANTAKVTNVTTNLSEGTSTETTVDVNSSDGTNATLVAANTSRAGVMTKAKFDEVVVNNAKVTNANHSGDATGSTALTLATVNSNVGSFTNADITVNGKGLITAAANGSAGGGITWNEVTGTTQGAAVDNGYITNNASLVTVTLPDTAALGSVVRISGLGAGGWKLAQNASELIYFGNSTTTTGTGGSLASTLSKDAIELVCVVANTEWSVISSIGNITVV